MTNRSRREHVLALLSLASLQPRYPTGRAVTAIVALGAPEAAAILGYTRCRSIVSSRLASLPDPSPEIPECVALLTPRTQLAERIRDRLDANLAAIDRLATDAGIEVFVFKGLGARAMYAEPAQRDLGDIDLFVRHRRDASWLCRVLRERGYAYNPRELPWLKADPAASLVYGQFNLIAPDESYVNVDIHFGDYSSRHCARVGLAGLLPAAGPGLHRVPPEENLACVVNNAAGDYFVTVKDTNDLLRALSLPSFDVSRFQARLRHAGLVDFFGFIRHRLRQIAVLTPAQEARLAQFPDPRAIEPAPKLDRPHWRRRYLGTTVHAFRHSRHHRGLGPALRIGLDAYRYYRKPLRLEVVPDSLDGDAERFDLNPWTCVRLVPVDLAQTLLAERPAFTPLAATVLGAHRLDLDPGVRRTDTTAGSYLTIEDEPFLATVYYRLPAALVAGAAVIGST